eukprot:Blabericola_migrator_1__13586@NODE_99_length_14373_cov_95_300643_g89_i0_p7_GENE_NODE_99_length_14373_cov_95_300643_g89_i0NODE_99_length_14373_cov_95_300643_g89_i0_p7_ORF_typecomplete_len260_score74_36Ribosomal_L30_N/PF08079_12/0_03Ribosomal_L30_N/PF08079_12/1_4e04_NODE_99_length_14373_cov_95_300643_g89_i090429821
MSSDDEGSTTAETQSDGSLLKVKTPEEVIRDSETVLKKRKYDLEARSHRARKLAEKKKEARAKIRAQVPLSLDAICRRRLMITIDQRRRRHQTKFAAPKLKVSNDVAKVLLVVKNIYREMSAVSWRDLQELGLTRQSLAILLPNTKESMKRLKAVEHFVYYGHPTIEIIRDLFVKHGYLKSGEPLSNNLLVEEAFGEQGLLSIDDLVHEIYTCGEAFETIVQNLKPFTLDVIKSPERDIDTGRLSGFEENFESVIKMLL